MSTFNFFDHYIEKINSLWIKLIGNQSEFHLENRIFHSISLSIICLAAIYIPYNFYAGLYISSLSALIVGFIYFYQYYNSRYLGKPHNDTLFALTGLFIFGVNYFSNAGINGSTDIIWPTYLLLLFAVSHYRHHINWLIIYIAFFLILHLIEFTYPNLVQNPFITKNAHFTDRITAIPLAILVIYISFNFIRRSYDKERKLVLEKTLLLSKSNEQILIQNELLEKSNADKSKLMSIISHDLRSPLMNIQSYLILLNEYEMDSKERNQIENTLLKSTENAIDMLSNILHWSKSQMEGPNAQPIPVNLKTVLLSTIEMGKIAAVKKEIIFNHKLCDEMNVIADVDMLQLVIRNLLVNAIKFTPKGGQVDIIAERSLNECKITVADNGVGIPKEKQRSIFSIQTKPAYGTNKEVGVGLGLALCKEYVDLQNGRIDFISDEATGTQFFVYLPIATDI
ncbi:histidine kinase [Pedobacter psychrophilus]|uniref:histidine kinase n=1 Tax=Pedobacter psychrophilus TaxID=1826909 RepID=A0A179DB04_9SPHI|nr:HAMP domain-containing sensor histidine kinase [Pedobacter psychrophilus]OAQ38231.1 histidine kinase [Pedobacter psychrophilus]